MNNDRPRFRQFIVKHFSDEELNNLCFDYFPLVYNEFTTGMPKSQKARLLVDACRRGDRLPDLQAALKRERPEVYEAFFSAAPSLPPSPPESVERNPRQIFMSHAHQDASFAERLAGDLRARDWQIWTAPESIRPGEKWVEAINRGLAESGVFLLLLTEASVASRWVQSEANAAIGMEHRGEMRFLPLEIESVTAPPLWQGYHWISFQDDYKNGLENLLETLQPEPMGRLSGLYGQLQEAVGRGDWDKAQTLGQEILDQDPDYRETKGLVALAEREAARPQALQEDQESRRQRWQRRLRPLARLGRPPVWSWVIIILIPLALWVVWSAYSENRAQEELAALNAELAALNATANAQMRTAITSAAASPETPEEPRPRPTTTTPAPTRTPAPTLAVIVRTATRPVLRPRPINIVLGKDGAISINIISEGFANDDYLDYLLEDLYILSPPDHGVLTPADGVYVRDGFIIAESVTYQPFEDYVGTDSFTYEVCDDIGSCATGTVNLTIRPVSDAPTATQTADGNGPPPSPQLGDAWTRPTDGMVMVYVPPPGTPFTLASGVEAPQEGYWIDKYEVSNAQYEMCVDAGECAPSAFAQDERFNGADYPVVGVSWDDAVNYGAWAGAELPTEGEWEYAAVGDSGRDYPWGNEASCELANYVDCVGSTSAVDSYPEGASWVGALNMAGNVWEWTSSWYDEGQDSRVSRGGSWWYPQGPRSVTLRNGDPPGDRLNDRGFRLVVRRAQHDG